MVVAWIEQNQSKLRSREKIIKQHISLGDARRRTAAEDETYLRQGRENNEEKKDAWKQSAKVLEIPQSRGGIEDETNVFSMISIFDCASPCKSNYISWPFNIFLHWWESRVNYSHRKQLVFTSRRLCFVARSDRYAYEWFLWKHCLIDYLKEELSYARKPTYLGAVGAADWPFIQLRLNHMPRMARAERLKEIQFKPYSWHWASWRIGGHILNNVIVMPRI
jgi:hypothetical protein